MHEKLKNLCFVDVETTGLDPSIDRIVAYCFLRFEEVSSKKLFTADESHSLLVLDSLVNPQGRLISESAKKVNCLDDAELFKQPTFEDQHEDIINFVQGYKLVAHNSNFDKKFLKAEFKRIGKDIEFEFIDTLSLIKNNYPGLPKYSLDFLCEIMKIDKNGHSASGDAVALYQLFVRCELHKFL
jgi:DNA polymerase-3 subunit epsilon